MKLSAENIQSNWKVFLNNIETHISDNKDRKQKLLNFYKKYEERIILMPAAHKKEYHNAFPGGYVDHVNRVVQASIALHDLGKIGDSENEAYVPQTDQWRKDKLGEDYMFNKSLAFASVPDRTLFLLQQHDIYYSFNEMLAIQTHDGLYDVANEKYLKGFMPEQRPRTSLPFILHQADMLASRVEWEQEWLPKFSQNNLEGPKKQFNLKNKSSVKNKALNTVSSKGLKNMLDNL